MIKRNVEISREPHGVHLTVRDGQLLVLRKLEPPRPLPARPANLAGSIPCEDLGVVMVDQRDTTYSHAALAALAEHGAALVVCGRDHLPAGMFLPVASNSHLLARLGAQLSASKPTRKRLWAEIVAAKVRAQRWALPEGPDTDACRAKLGALARAVRSGDPANIEAQAAVHYWPVLFRRSTFVVHPFRRRPGEGQAPSGNDPGQAGVGMGVGVGVGAGAPNNLLDYGYAVLRAAVARTAVSAGLLPALGIKHRGRSNAFCLADDLMEPLRPLVDRRARWLAERGELSLDQPTKAELLGVLTDEVECGTDDRGVPLRGPLMVALVRYVASFVRVLTGEGRSLVVPTLADRGGGGGGGGGGGAVRSEDPEEDVP